MVPWASIALAGVSRKLTGVTTYSVMVRKIYYSPPFVFIYYTVVYVGLHLTFFMCLSLVIGKIIYLLLRQEVNSCRESILHVGVTLQEDSPTELQLTKIVSMPALAPLLIS